MPEQKNDVVEGSKYNEAIEKVNSEKIKREKVEEKLKELKTKEDLALLGDIFSRINSKKDWKLG